jgi:hypothetical protein
MSETSERGGEPSQGLEPGSSQAATTPPAAALAAGEPAPVGGEPALAAGTVYDVGYKRYLGTRMPQSTRWKVILRQQVSFAWKTWWRYKAALVLAVIATMIAGAIMYIAADSLMRILGGGSAGVRFADGILPLSVVWYCKIGFVSSMTLAATVVSNDLRSGAFTFYFARAVRPWDYVIGKATGLVALAAILMMAGPVLLALLRLGLSESTDQMLAQLPNVGYAFLVGALATLVYSVIPLGFSALVTDRRWALGLWALYYVAIGSMMSGLGLVLWAPLAALDLPTALLRSSFSLFHLDFATGGTPNFSIGWAIGSVLLHSAVAIAVTVRRVTKASREGVGGGS